MLERKIVWVSLLRKTTHNFSNYPICEVVLNRSSTSVMIVVSEGGTGSTKKWFSEMEVSWMLTGPKWLYYTSFLHEPHLHNWIMKHLCAKESECKRPPELNFCLASLHFLSLSALNIWNWLWTRVTLPKVLFRGVVLGISLLVPLLSFFCLSVIFFLTISSFSTLAFSKHPLNKTSLPILPLATQANTLLG